MGIQASITDSEVYLFLCVRIHLIVVIFSSIVLVLVTIGLYSARFLPAAISPAVRIGLTCLRAVWFVFLVWLFLRDPKVIHREKVALEPILPVVVDDSESMALPALIRPAGAQDRPDTKWRVVREIVGDRRLASELARRGFEERTYTLSELQGLGESNLTESAPLPRAPILPTTNLAGPLRDLAEQYPQNRCPGFLFLTDGQWNRGGDPMRVAWIGDATPAFAFYAIGIGDPNPPTDFRLASISAPPTVRSGRMGLVTVHGDAVDVQSQTTGRLHLELRAADGDIQWATEIERTFAAGDARWHETVPFPAVNAGTFELTAELTVPGPDIDPDNNLIQIDIQILENLDRVLMLTGGPDWDFKLVKRALENDPFTEVEAILYRTEGPVRLGDRDWVRQRASGSRANPEPLSQSAVADLEKLDQWSLIVLHGLRLGAERSTLRDRIAVYAENGGALLVLPGGLGKFADVYWPCNPTQTQVTILNREASPIPRPGESASLLANPVLAAFDKDLPPLARLFVVDPLPAGTQTVLACRPRNENRAFPLVTEIRHGLGRVVQVYSDTLWRWKMYARPEEQDAFGRFCRVLVHLLAPSSVPSMGRLLVSDPSPQVGESVQVILELTPDSETREESYRVTVNGPEREMVLSLAKDPTNPLRASTELVPSASGVYRLRESRLGLEARFAAAPLREERLRASQNTAFLRKMAETTGGAYVEDANQWRSLLDRIPRRETIIEREHQRFWASRFWALGCLIGLLALEWFARQRQGLP